MNTHTIARVVSASKLRVICGKNVRLFSDSEFRATVILITTQHTPNKKKEITLDEVLLVTKQGFDCIDRNFATVNKRFDSIEKRLDGVSSRIDAFDTKVNMMYGVLDKWPTPAELDDLFYRIAYIEKHLKTRRQAKKAA